MSVILFWKKQFIATLLNFVAFRSRILHCYDSGPRFTTWNSFQFAGTMSREESGVLWSTDRTSWADAEIQGFHGLQKNRYDYGHIHFKGPHIFVQMYVYTHFWINFEFSSTSNYSLSKFICIYILRTMVQIICKGNDYPDQPIGSITWGFDCQPSNPFQPWAGTQGWIRAYIIIFEYMK